MENTKPTHLKPKREISESPFEKIILGGFPVYIKMAFLIIAWAFFIYCAIDASYKGYWFMFFYAIGGVLHEPGHFFFALFHNMPLNALGGTIFQLGLPVAFLIYFLRKGQLYSGSFIIFWIGYTFLAIAIYMDDSIDMILPPLIPFPGGIHDWNYLFTLYGVLPQAHLIATITRVLGFAIIMIGGIVGVLSFFRKKKVEVEQF